MIFIGAVDPSFSTSNNSLHGRVTSVFPIIPDNPFHIEITDCSGLSMEGKPKTIELFCADSWANLSLVLRKGDQIIVFHPDVKLRPDRKVQLEHDYNLVLNSSTSTATIRIISKEFNEGRSFSISDLASIEPLPENVKTTALSTLPPKRGRPAGSWLVSDSQAEVEACSQSQSSPFKKLKAKGKESHYALIKDLTQDDNNANFYGVIVNCKEVPPQIKQKDHMLRLLVRDESVEISPAPLGLEDVRAEAKAEALRRHPGLYVTLFARDAKLLPSAKGAKLGDIIRIVCVFVRLCMCVHVRLCGEKRV
jgi:hypothetical protein